MHILTISSLYPNSAMPTFGIFVENRLRHLTASGSVSAHVVAPVPWFPFSGKLFGEYGRWAKVSDRERRNGLTVDHPRYLVLPKIGMRIQADMLLHRLRGHVARLMKEGIEIDLIDAHYFYPDGVAAVRLGRELNVPVVVTARGTDINFYPQAFPAIRQAIVETAQEADGIVAVCQALKDAIVSYGIDDERVTVLRNGVDLAHFWPRPREPLRQDLGVSGPTILSVGYLIDRKGHHIAIEALTLLPDHKLLIVGEGPEKERLMSLAVRLQVSERVRFLGSVSYDQMPLLYNAADVLCPGIGSRGVGKRFAGSHGLRDACGRYEYLGYARGRRFARGGPSR